MKLFLFSIFMSGLILLYSCGVGNYQSPYKYLWTLKKGDTEAEALRKLDFSDIKKLELFHPKYQVTAIMITARTEVKLVPKKLKTHDSKTRYEKSYTFEYTPFILVFENQKLLTWGYIYELNNSDNKEFAELGKMVLEKLNHNNE